MAPKRPNPREEPPAASSSEEHEKEQEEEEEEDEEEESSEEEREEEDDAGSSSGEEEEGEEAPPSKTPEPSTQTPAPAAAPKSPSSDSTESGSETDSDSDSPDGDVKALATKPMEETPVTRKARSKPSASPLKSTAKRLNESEQRPKEVKRARKDAEDDGVSVEDEGKKPADDAKKQLFQRLWSEEDELALLKGVLDYSAKKKTDPFADMNAFHDFIKKSIHVDFTRTQLIDKIRRLKKKYENKIAKAKKGQDRALSKPHEQKAYDLSKKIWGSEGITGRLESALKSNGEAGKTPSQKANSKPKASVKAEVLPSPDLTIDKQFPAFDKCIGVGGLEAEVIKHGFDMIGGAQRAKLEEKWRNLRIAELELFLQHNELVKELAKEMLDVYKSADK